MKQIIKNNFKQKKASFDEFFNANINLQSKFANLDIIFSQQENSLLEILDNSSSFTKSVDLSAQINKHLTEQFVQEKKTTADNELIAITEHFKLEEKKFNLSIVEKRKEMRKKINTLRENGFIFAEHITKQIKALEEQKNTKNEILTASFSAEKDKYLEKITALHDRKTKDIDRINLKQTEFTDDYNNKDSHRFTQKENLLIEAKDKKAAFVSFHEKDPVYAKQNYYKILTNLNDKINTISANYKILEKNIEDEYSQSLSIIFQNLNYYNKRIDIKNNDILTDFENHFKVIDEKLYTLRKDYQEKTQSLKQKHDRAITTINVDYQNLKDKTSQQKKVLEKNYQELTKTNEVTNKQLKIFKKTYNKQISLLNKELKIKERLTRKKIQTTFKDYKTNVLVVGLENVLENEKLQFEQKQNEQIKNKSLKLNANLKALYELESKTLEVLTAEEKTINSSILNNQMNLEIIPLDIQTSLATHIYNSESHYQNLEQEYNNEKINKEIELIELKSLLHSHNLTKTLARTTLNYNYEIKTTNLNYYLMMEHEKNSLRHKSDLLVFEKELNEQLFSIERLKNNHKKELKDQNVKYQQELAGFFYKMNEEEMKLNKALLHLKKAYQSNKSVINLEEDIILTMLKEPLSYFIDDYSILQTITNNKIKIINIIFQTNKKFIFQFKENLCPTINTDSFNQGLDFFEKALSTDNTLLIIQTNNLYESFVAFLDAEIKATTNQYNVNKAAIEEFNKQKKAYLETLATSYDKDLNTLERELKAIKTTINKLITQNEMALNQISLINKKIEDSKKTNDLNSNAYEELVSLKKSLINLIAKNKNELALLKYRLEFVEEDYAENFKLRQRISKLFLTTEKHYSSSLNKIATNLKTNLNKKNKTLEKSTKINTKIIKLNTTFNNKFNCLLNKLRSPKANNKSANKYFKQLVYLFMRVQRKHNSFFANYKSFFNKNYTANINNQEKFIFTMNKNYSNSIQQMDKTYAKKVVSYNHNLKKLSVFNNQYLALNKDRFNHLLKKLNQEQLVDLKDAQEIEDAINKKVVIANDDFNSLVKAFNANKDDVLTKENETLKNNLKTSLNTNNENIKITNHNIKKISNELLLLEKRYEAQLAFYATNDKDTRKKLSTKQLTSVKKESTMIANFQKSLPKIASLKNETTTKTKIEVAKLHKKTSSKKIYLNLINKITFKFTLYNRKKLFKRELFEQLKS